MNFSTMTTRQLRSFCKDNQVSGYSKHASRKADLVAFLEAYTAQSLEQQQEQVTAVVEATVEAIEDKRKKVARAIVARFDAIATALSTPQGWLTLAILALCYLVIGITHLPGLLVKAYTFVDGLASDAVESGRIARVWYEQGMARHRLHSDLWLGMAELMIAA